jgi:hypothetical protein
MASSSAAECISSIGRQPSNEDGTIEEEEEGQFINYAAGGRGDFFVKVKKCV